MGYNTHVKCSRKVCATKNISAFTAVTIYSDSSLLWCSRFQQMRSGFCTRKICFYLSLIYSNINNVTMNTWNISKRFITSFYSWQSAALLINYKNAAIKKGAGSYQPSHSTNQKISVTIRKTQSWQIWTSYLTFSVSEESSHLEKHY